MSSENRFRRLPPICALVAVLRFFTGRLRFENRYVDRVFVLEDGQRFRAFRHLSQKASGATAQTSPAVFVWGTLSVLVLNALIMVVTSSAALWALR